MKVSTSDRLQEIMKKNEMRQVDILKKAEPYCLQYNIKLGRNDLSQYVSGKVIPGQEKLTILAKALNVNEVWLMGYDVPIERNDYEDRNILRFDAEFDDALDILVKNGYSWNLSQTPDCDVVIKNSAGKIVSCMQDFELVSKYESMQKKGIIKAEYLLNPIDYFSLSDIEIGHINKYRSLDDPGRTHVDTVLDWEATRTTKAKEAADQIKALKEQTATIPLARDPAPDYLAVNAAHERTDIEITDEMRQMDDDIMKNF